jgi:hypothetical protein
MARVERDQDPPGLGLDHRLRTQVVGARADPTGWFRWRHRNCGRRLCADDVAFGMSGSLYITTHPEHTLVRLNPSGARTTLAGPEQGMVGSTACAFGRAPGDQKALYVTTDGGFLIPHESGIQDAKLVRLEVGESGWPLLQRSVTETIRIAILDDYQNVSLEMADWSPIAGRVAITVFNCARAAGSSRLATVFAVRRSAFSASAILAPRSRESASHSACK